MEILQHPKPLWTLAFGKLWDTFSYYGTQTILVLYFIHIFHLPRDQSILLYGAYAAFTYSIPVLGGVLGDNWLGSRNTLVIGVILNVFGNFLLMSYQRHLFCLGLALSLVGSGLYKSTATQLAGGLYPEGESRKETGYTILYLAVNVGGSLGPLVYGFVVYAIGWNTGFLCSALGILLGLAWVLCNWSNYHDTLQNIKFKSKTAITALLFILLLIILLNLTFYYLSLINIIIGIFFACSLGYILIKILSYKGQTRQQLLALLTISFFGMFYFAAGMQIGSSITLFLQYKIHLGVIPVKVPASTFSTLYCLFVLLQAPFITCLWSKLKSARINVSIINKLTAGIMLGSLGIACFALAAGTNLIIFGLIFGILLLSAGELVISPAVYTVINDLAPHGMKATMIGSWYFFIGLGGYFSSLLLRFSDQFSKYLPFNEIPYLSEFLFIAIFIAVIALCLLLLTSRLNRMLSITRR